ncbi:MAG: FAD-dependent oxidoreductase, partial [Dehalococcoidia bacterium]
TADVFISALPFDLLRTVLPPPLAGDPFFARAQGLSTSPIVNLHIWYDRPVLQDDFVAVLDSPLQWVFNKSRIFGEQQGNGQYLSLSLSGAWEYIDQPKDQLRELFLAEMARIFPQARSATVERFLVVKQERATFRCTPGAAGHRLPAATPVPNLVLAGEWTDTGWPSTMEGAVRSGNTAAQEVLRGTWR